MTTPQPTTPGDASLAPLPCIACKAPLAAVVEGFASETGYVQPDHAVILTSPGTYGSAVFDPMDDTYVAVNICDACLSAALGSGSARICSSAD